MIPIRKFIDFRNGLSINYGSEEFHICITSSRLLEIAGTTVELRHTS